MSDIDDRLLALVDSVVAYDEKCLPLLTLREARATIELLQLLSARRRSVGSPAPGRQPGPKAPGRGTLMEGIRPARALTYGRRRHEGHAP
ncbi:hypothetical protein [Streptomyces decoyicus]|uniref:hypothetical protein n=1 Tax=Streptomyces decoyicus TaxID=249567 RepID=UPI000B09C3B6|nr:hypothetical protein [Streptomyces decoyicus]QZY21028.1 hypothetical protein K7C20_00635 [Streptomyces decoyicus]